MIMNSGDTLSKILHPLHPPRLDEINNVGTIVKNAMQGDVDFSSIALIEPPKEEVKAFPSKGRLERRFRVAGYDRDKKQSFYADINSSDSTLEDVSYIEGAHSGINFTDVVKANTIIKSDSAWLAAMKKRGVEDVELVQIDPWPSGGFIHESAPAGHRVMRGISFLKESKTDNGYARPVQGLIAHVDLTDEKVIHVEDHGVVPFPPEHARYDADSQPSLREAPKPISITQPEGVGFSVDAYTVNWQKWKFSVSMHPIHGLVLHQLSYDNRSILYRASLSDMVVPYGDPDPMHGWKHVFDASEASIGTIPNSLTLGCDCLGEIVYLDVHLMNHKGEGRTVENAICMHEEDYGILWKHYDGNTRKQEVRRSRRLVISSIHTVGNYEYGFFWYLYLDGTIQMEVKLTGIVGISAVTDDGERSEFAPLIAPNLASPIHQHLFNFRLDFDLEDAPMSVLETNAVPLAADDPDNPYGTAFRAETTLLKTEQLAQREVNPASSRSWKVVSTKVSNRLGKPIGYKLLPAASPVLYAHDSSATAKRAAFAKHNLWVTPYSDQELSAAGDFTNLHGGGEGLPQWTKNNRSTADTDIVMWHTVGVTHIPRPEDWPVMPVEYCGFHLLPSGFFDRNPALDLPPNKHC